MAEQVPFVDTTAANWCPGCANFHLWDKHWPVRLYIVRWPREEQRKLVNILKEEFSVEAQQHPLTLLKVSS
jgi:hypothetical protein